MAHLRGEMVAAIDSCARHVQAFVAAAAAAASGDADRARLANEIKLGSIALEQADRAFTERWTSATRRRTRRNIA